MDAIDGRRRLAEMVEHQLEARGIRDARVLQAVRDVPRWEFVPEALRRHTWDDRPIPIAEGQAISQPFVVALMLEALALQPADRVLEVGAGSGYAAALLARLCAHVDALEWHQALVDDARATLARLGVTNVDVERGDGSLGWAERAPFDAILVSAGGPAVPPALVEQLALGGRLVIPVGPAGGEQRLLRIRRSADGELTQDDLGPVAFVPLLGAAGHDGVES